MPQINRSKLFPYPAAKIFNLVADIESYPLFIPWCADAKLLKKDDHNMLGKLIVKKGGLKKTFTTQNNFQYPHWMKINLASGSLRNLSGEWQFIEKDVNSCEVHYRMNIELPFFLVPMFSGILEYMANNMVDCFAKRANDLYG